MINNPISENKYTPKLYTQTAYKSGSIPVQKMQCSGAPSFPYVLFFFYREMYMCLRQSIRLQPGHTMLPNWCGEPKYVHLAGLPSAQVRGMLIGFILR